MEDRFARKQQDGHDMRGTRKKTLSARISDKVLLLAEKT